MKPPAKTIHFPGRQDDTKPAVAPARIVGHLAKVQAAKGGKVHIVIEAEISDPAQTELKKLLDLQHGPVSIQFAEAGE
jgi:hypothetical protein